MSQRTLQEYSHSPVHYAIACRDYTGLRQILAALPALPRACEVVTEEDSVIAEQTADKVSAVVDRRDVPGRETPLHLAVGLCDVVAVEMLMAAGADWSLQNEQGWSALQEAVCLREHGIAMIMTRYYQPLAWAKWCRRLPRITGAMRRMKDFYMEITFHFESSVIPFISRIAPSDTYKIWKQGCNLRADTTLGDFDGFKIQRSDQSFLFLGDGTADGVVPPGSLLVLAHKNKEISDALEGVKTQPSDTEIAKDISIMTRTNMYRPGLDVMQAELLPQLNWRRQEKTEMVGQWKAKIYDMHHVQISVKSRRVPGSMTDEELFADDSDAQALDEDNHGDLLTEDERQRLEFALGMDNVESGSNGFDGCTKGSTSIDYGGQEQLHSRKCKTGLNTSHDHRKNWLSWGKESTKLDSDKTKTRTSSKNISSASKPTNAKLESEYKKGLRPVLWLTSDFPLKTEELLPLLDILADKVKAIRRLKELLTTKLPLGTFPVKVAIPIVPTIRVVVTFNKFEELPGNEEFETPLSSPTYFSDARNQDQEKFPDEVDAFLIPTGYTWTDMKEKKRRLKAKKAAKSRK